jgi:hypothetical protein
VTFERLAGMLRWTGTEKDELGLNRVRWTVTLSRGRWLFAWHRWHAPEFWPAWWLQVGPLGIHRFEDWS